MKQSYVRDENYATISQSKNKWARNMDLKKDELILYKKAEYELIFMKCKYPVAH